MRMRVVSCSSSQNRIRQPPLAAMRFPLRRKRYHQPAGLVSPFNNCSDVVHVRLNSLHVPSVSRVGFNVPRPNAEHAHQQHTEQEREDASPFRRRCARVSVEARTSQQDLPVVTSSDASCNVNSMTSPLVCQTASEFCFQIGHPSNVVRQQVQPSGVHGPVFTRFKADSSLVGDGRSVTDQPRRTS